MRATSLILFLLIVYSLTEGLEGKRRWIRRTLRRIRWRVVGKRDTGNNTKELPCQFSKWDSNQDGKVDQTEFKSMLNDQENDITLEKLFILSDINDDTFISEEELRKAPLPFDC